MNMCSWLPILQTVVVVVVWSQETTTLFACVSRAVDVVDGTREGREDLEAPKADITIPKRPEWIDPKTRGLGKAVAGADRVPVPERTLVPAQVFEYILPCS